MKRVISLFLAAVLTLSLLCSCAESGKEEPSEPDTAPNEEQNEPEEPEEPEETVTVNYKEKQKLRLADIKDKIIINGRCPFEEDGTLLLSWSNSGIEISGWFDGAVKIYYTVIDEGVHLHTVVDGEENKEKLVTLSPDVSFFVAADFRAKGYHTVSIYKAEEGRTNKLWLDSVEFNGKLDEEPVQKVLSIEVVGDSISCGTGLVSPDGLDNDAFFSYGARIARNTRSSLSVVAVSGWGLNCGIQNFDNVVPKIYDETAHFPGHTEPWDYAANPVDAIIVNLGTNDWTEYHDKDRTELLDAANAFFDKLRTYYPDAYIYFTYGMMSTAFLQDFIDLVEKRGDDHVEFVEVTPNSSGIGNHPDSAAHEEYSLLFEGYLRKQFKLSSKIKAYDEAIEHKKSITVIAEE